jgi:hypothetical protein
MIRNFAEIPIGSCVETKIGPGLVQLNAARSKSNRAAVPAAFGREEEDRNE